MTPKEKAIASLKSLAKIMLGKDEPTITLEAKFTDAKLVDGTIIRYDAEVLATGVIVSVVDESGNILPMPIGSYEMEDGTTFDIVDINGTADNVVLAEAEVVEEIAPALAEVKPEAPAEMEVAKPVIPQHAKSVIESITKETRFEDVTEKFEAQKLSFETQIKTVTEKLEAQDKLIKDLFAAIEVIGNEDIATATDTKKNVFKRKTYQELRASFRAQLGA